MRQQSPWDDAVDADDADALVWQRPLPSERAMAVARHGQEQEGTARKKAVEY